MIWPPFRSVFHLWTNIKKYYLLLTHRDTPWHIKGLAISAIIYLVSPYDFIPDWLAGLGIIDDVAIVSLLLGYAVRLAKKSKARQIDHDESGES